MRRRRKLSEARLLCSGPGRVCQALGITGAHNALALNQPPFELRGAKAEVRDRNRAAHRDHQGSGCSLALWQKGSRFLSRAFK